MVHPRCDCLVLEIISYAWRISETYAAIEKSMIQIGHLDHPLRFVLPFAVQTDKGRLGQSTNICVIQDLFFVRGA